MQSQAAVWLRENSREITAGLVSMLGELYEHNEGSPEKRLRLLKLLEVYTSSRYDQWRALADQLITSYTSWLGWEFEAAWVGRVKASPTIDLLFRLLIETVGQLQEDYYLEMSPCLYRTLQLLREPDCTEHHEELVTLLGHVLRMEQAVSG